MIDSQVIHKIRKVYRLSLADMAALLNVTESYLCRIEKKQRSLSERVRRNLIDEFALTPDKLERITGIYAEFHVEVQR